MHGALLSRKVFPWLTGLFLLTIGLGRINLKSYGIPFSYGGSLENLILWPILMALPALWPVRHNFFKTYRTPLLLTCGLILWLIIVRCNKSLSSIGIEEWTGLMMSLGVFVLALIAEKLNPQKRSFYILCLLCGILMSLLRGGWLLIFGEETFTLLHSSHGRLLTPLGHPNFLGGALVLLFPLTFGFTWHSKPQRTLKVMRMGFAAVMVAGLILCYSRSAWIGAGVATLAFFMLKNKKTNRRCGLIWGLCIFACVWFPTLLPSTPTHSHKHPAVERLLSLSAWHQDSNLLERISCWQSSMRLLPKHGWTGMGPGHDRFETEYVKVQAPSATTLMPHPHNIYLHALLTLGLPGAGLLFGLIFTGYRSARHGRHLMDPTLAEWQTACLAGLVGFAFYGLLDSPLYAGRVTAITGWVLALLFSQSSKRDSFPTNLEAL